MSAAAARDRASLGIVYFTVFLDLLGFGIVLPSIPFYAERLGATGLWLGALLTAYSFAQLLGAAILGRLSDRFGRRPILILSLAGAAVAMVLTGLAETLLALVAARALAGLFGGSISTAQAYVADVTEPEERAAFMGHLGASIGMGFVLGPALGAFLARFGFETVAFVAAGLAAANCLFAVARLRESHTGRTGAAAAEQPGRLGRALRRPGIPLLLAAVFCTMFAFVAMETTLAFLGELRWGLTERDFGLLLVLAGAVLAGIQGAAIGPLTRRFGERALAAGGSLGMALLLVLLPLAPSLPFAAAVLAVLAACRGLTLPTLSTLLSQASDVEDQGGILGISQSMASAARAVGPLLAGWLYDQGPTRPYLLATVVALLAAVAVLAPRVTLSRRLTPGS